MRNVWMQVGVGLFGVVAVVAALREATPQARSRKAAATPAVSTPALKHVVPAVPAQAAPQQAPAQTVAQAPATQAPVTQAPVVALPKGTADQLRAWLLSASDAEFAPLVGTKELDAAVAQVVNGFSFQEASTETTSREVDDFLTRINSRIQSVACAK